MAGFKKFEEILAWQKARKTAKRIYEITAKGGFCKRFRACVIKSGVRQCRLWQILPKVREDIPIKNLQIF